MSEYKRPISLIDFQIAIRELSDSDLDSIFHKLQNSITRLVDSNNLMQNLMDKEKNKGNKEFDYKEEEEDDDDEFNPVTDNDIEIFINSINENKIVIDNQLQRCEIIKNELDIRNMPVNTHPDIVKIKNDVSNSIISSDNDAIIL